MTITSIQNVIAWQIGVFVPLKDESAETTYHLIMQLDNQALPVVLILKTATEAFDLDRALQNEVWNGQDVYPDPFERAGFEYHEDEPITEKNRSAEPTDEPITPEIVSEPL